MFNIYLNDLFYILNDVDICNYADDTTPNVCDSSLKVVIEKLEKSSQLAIKWFNHNHMKLNTEKCEFLITGHRFEHLWLDVGETQVWEKNQVKLLGVTIDNELKLDDHITKICRKANSKLSALSRLARYLSMEQKKLLYMSFIEAQFKYCPLTWMFCSRSCNNKINKLHERALRLVYDDYESSFDVLLNKNKSFSIHHQNIQKLMIEAYKSLNKPSPDNYFDSLFMSKRRQDPLQNDLLVPSVKTVTKGKDSAKYLGAVTWNSIPSHIRQQDSLEKFCDLIKKWKPDCKCTLCKDYIGHIDYIQIVE